MWRFTRKIFLVVLNLPYTLLGIMVAFVSVPRQVYLYESVLVIAVRELWWTRILLWWKKDLTTDIKKRGAKGVALGHLVLVGSWLSKEEKMKVILHESIHVEQHERYPLVFPLIYWIETLRYGYVGNRFEKEAYERSDTWTESLLDIKNKNDK